MTAQQSTVDEYRVHVRAQSGRAAEVRVWPGAEETFEEAISTGLRRSGCSANSTRIVRLEPGHHSSYIPSGRGARWLDSIADMLGLQERELARTLVVAWREASISYVARSSLRDGRRYTLHAFEGPLPILSGPIEGELTCLHPALTTDAHDVFEVIGEARLTIGTMSLVLEFDDRIDGGVGWQAATVDEAGWPAVHDEFPETRWVIVEQQPTQHRS